MGYAVDAGAAVAVWLLTAGESVGKRAYGRYVGLSELSPEEEAGKYVGAPAVTVCASGDGASFGAMLTPSGRKYIDCSLMASIDMEDQDHMISAVTHLANKD